MRLMTSIRKPAAQAIATAPYQPGPAVSSPPVQKCCAEMMSVSVAGIPKNRCRTTVAEPIGETRAELTFTGDQVGLFRAQLGRPNGGMIVPGLRIRWVYTLVEEVPSRGSALRRTKALGDFRSRCR